MNKLLLDELVLKAAGMALVVHHGQTRRNNKHPYVTHPNRVAREVSRMDGVTPQVVAAAFLHDVVEDTNITLEQVTETFGLDVAELVESLTNISHNEEHKDKPRKERKRLDREFLRHAPRWAKVIKLVDRLDNLKEMSEDSEDFIKLYCDESRLLADAIGSAHIPIADLIRNQCDSLEKLCANSSVASSA